MDVPEWSRRNLIDFSDTLNLPRPRRRNVQAEIHHHVLKSTTTRSCDRTIVRASNGTHHILRSKSKAPRKRAVAVNVITTVIDHLLDTRLRPSLQVEGTKFHTTQRDGVMIGRIRYILGC
jgi:hypothetical protein